MPVDKVSRRRALVMMASVAAFPSEMMAAGKVPFEWRGTALGADARLLLWADDQRMARDAIDACTAEIERLERIFSLYRHGSEISRLNRQSVLEAPSHDFVSLLYLSRKMHRISSGLFDPTVQALWELYESWYGRRGAAEPPPDDLVSVACSRVGMEKLDILPGRIDAHDGARLTLNGIAQGYITDRVAELLRLRGWNHVLIDLGEVRALDGKPDGTPWRIGIREMEMDIPLSDEALATSAGNTLTFGENGDGNHIFHPRTGRSVAHWRSVTVAHPSAAFADALSTALFVADPLQVKSIGAMQRSVRIWTVQTDGTINEYHS